LPVFIKLVVDCSPDDPTAADRGAEGGVLAAGAGQDGFDLGLM
jgi:hypothetical protein